MIQLFVLLLDLMVKRLLYDFQRALRKDARWQYTNNAREDVFQSVGKVLQDFGFQG
jgi:membrane protein required for beta-lactamase induction